MFKTCLPMTNLRWARRLAVGLLFFGIGLSHAVAKIADFTPVKMMVEAGDRVLVRGYRGGVEYVVNKTATDVTVELSQKANATGETKLNEDWQFSFKREGHEIQIFIEGPIAKQMWTEIFASQQIPEYFLKITGPPLPLEMNWGEGRIAVSDLDAEILITAFKGEVAVLRGEGDIRISNQEGIVRVRDRKGVVKIDSYTAKVDVDNIEGKLELDNFTGETDVQKVSGQVNFSSFKGNSKVQQVKGRFEFKNGNSPLYIEKFEGELRGHSAQGAIFAEIRGDADVRLESAEGAVNLQLPSSGAWVNLGSVEGALAVPSYLKLTRLPTQQIRTGRLKGSTGGSIFVRTSTGDIRIR